MGPMFQSPSSNESRDYLAAAKPTIKNAPYQNIRAKIPLMTLSRSFLNDIVLTTKIAPTSARTDGKNQTSNCIGYSPFVEMPNYIIYSHYHYFHSQMPKIIVE